KARFRELVCPGCPAKEDNFTLRPEFETDRMIDSVAWQFGDDFDEIIEGTCWNFDAGFERRRIRQNLPPVREVSFDWFANEGPAVAADLDKDRLAVVRLESERPISVLS